MDYRQSSSAASRAFSMELWGILDRFFVWDGVSEGGRAAARVVILLIYVTLIAMDWKEKLLPFEDTGDI
jgi:hypothetical protein